MGGVGGWTCREREHRCTELLLQTACLHTNAHCPAWIKSFITSWILHGFDQHRAFWAIHFRADPRVRKESMRRPSRDGDRQLRWVHGWFLYILAMCVCVWKENMVCVCRQWLNTQAETGQYKQHGPGLVLHKHSQNLKAHSSAKKHHQEGHRGRIKPLTQPGISPIIIYYFLTLSPSLFLADP